MHLATRRDLIAAAAVIATSGMSLSAANAAADVPPTEGYFMVYEPRGSGGDPETDTRIFFIPSAWLELFEVTDAYWQKNINPTDVVEKIRESRSSKAKRVRLYYGDNADIPNPVAGAEYIPPTKPPGGKTYLAMMISPGEIEEEDPI